MGNWGRKISGEGKEGGRGGGDPSRYAGVCRSPNSHKLGVGVRKCASTLGVNTPAVPPVVVHVS